MSAFDLAQRMVSASRGTALHDLALELREALLDETLPRYLAPDGVRAALTIAGNVCECGGVDLSRPRAHSRRFAHVNRARALAMYLLVEIGRLSLKRVAREMGLRDHTTVMYHRDKISDLMLADAQFAQRVRDAIAQYEIMLAVRPERAA